MTCSFVCKDCEYCRLSFYFFGTEFAKCYRPENLKIDRVSGKKKYEPTFCGVERKFDSLCGEKGRYFQPKSSKEIEYYEAMQDRRKEEQRRIQMFDDLKKLNATIYEPLDIYRLPGEYETHHSLSLLWEQYEKDGKTDISDKISEQKKCYKKDSIKEVAAFIRKKYKGEKLIMTNPEKLAKEIEEMEVNDQQI